MSHGHRCCNSHHRCNVGHHHTIALKDVFLGLTSVLESAYLLVTVAVPSTAYLLRYQTALVRKRTLTDLELVHGMGKVTLGAMSANLARRYRFAHAGKGQLRTNLLHVRQLCKGLLTYAILHKLAIWGCSHLDYQGHLRAHLGPHGGPLGRIINHHLDRDLLDSLLVESRGSNSCLLVLNVVIVHYDELAPWHDVLVLGLVQ